MVDSEQKPPQLLWIVDHAVAYVDSGRVTLQIDEPTRYLPRPEVFEVADKAWFSNQMRELHIARERRETKVIPLTDRRNRSSLRLGGGFMITQGKRLVVARRHLDAPRPGQFCECGGVFEFDPSKVAGHPRDLSNDYVASLLKESQEIALVDQGILYVPQLAPTSPEPIGFQPPGSLAAYNEIIEAELVKECGKAVVPITEGRIRKFWMKIHEYEQAVRLEFAYSPQLCVEVTPEIDNSSLECVGVLSLPEHIKLAAVAFLEERLIRLHERLKKEGDENERRNISNGIEDTKSQRDKAREEADRGGNIVYWDTEMNFDKKLKQETGPVDRDVHLIDPETGEIQMWRVAGGDGPRRREMIKTTLGEQLSETKLGPDGTSGRFSTEKLEKAIKMHCRCPSPHLQPLVTW